MQEGVQEGYLFKKLLKEETGTCINHNYFTLTKISKRRGTWSPLERSNAERMSVGERQKERDEVNR